jgi:hydrogenase maturation protease
MNRLLGVGSPFGADRLAWKAIDYLACLGLSDCELIKLDRPGSQLISHFKGVEQVVIIDAVRLADYPGRVSAINPEKIHHHEYLTSCHGFGVSEAVALAGQLGELPPRLYILGIHTGEDVNQLPDIELETLSSLVHQLLKPLV